MTQNNNYKRNSLDRAVDDTLQAAKTVTGLGVGCSFALMVFALLLMVIGLIGKLFI